MEPAAIQVAQKLEAVFGAIQHGRMADVPILNAALSVAAVGTQRFGVDWLAILVTPWCMNIMLLPVEPDSDGWQEWRLGDTVRRNLPGGVFGFICGEEAALGRYLMCSLFSPMQDFIDQPAALATAEAAIKELTAPPAESEQAPQDARSRRAMFGLARKAEEMAP